MKPSYYLLIIGLVLNLNAHLAKSATIQAPVTLQPSDFAGAQGLTTFTTTISGTQVTLTAGNTTAGTNPVLFLSPTGNEIGVFSNNELLTGAASFTINSNRGNGEFLQFDLVSLSGSGRAITGMDFNRIQQTAQVVVESLSNGASTTFDVAVNTPISFPATTPLPGLAPGSTGLRVTIRNGIDVQIGWQQLTIIPEPSKSLLVLVGGALVFLQRKRTSTGSN